MQLRGLIVLLCLSVTIHANGHPTQAFMDMQGHKIRLTDFKNKWVIINYWATWCDACAEEVPQLNLFYQRHHNEMMVLGVNYDRLSVKNLEDSVNAMHIQFPVLQGNPAKAFGLPEISVLPVTFIINPEGKIVRELLGPQTVKGLEEITHAYH